ncbi:DUF305 domain-containing protein [Brevibacterium luteolum]|uniref:DUF305 domain-containing protein n=1 Tax=Brevibacterium luteolum TaxID=199591 RepID=A0A6G8L0G7_9MICO|nr:DUF305 domain-containing protein [Brevibacterium luteolum]
MLYLEDVIENHDSAVGLAAPHVGTGRNPQARALSHHLTHDQAARPRELTRMLEELGG